MLTGERKNVNRLLHPERFTARELRYLSGDSLESFWAFTEEIIDKEVQAGDLEPSAIALVQRIKVL